MRLQKNLSLICQGLKSHYLHSCCQVTYICIDFWEIVILSGAVKSLKVGDKNSLADILSVKYVNA